MDTPRTPASPLDTVTVGELCDALPELRKELDDAVQMRETLLSTLRMAEDDISGLHVRWSQIEEIHQDLDYLARQVGLRMLDAMVAIARRKADTPSPRAEDVAAESATAPGGPFDQDGEPIPDYPSPTSEPAESIPADEIAVAHPSPRPDAESSGPPLGTASGDIPATAPPATAEQLAALKRKFETGASPAEALTRESALAQQKRRQDELRRIRKQLSRTPETFEHIPGLRAELALLVNATAEDELNRWVEFLLPVDLLLLSNLVAARMRAVQDAAEARGLDWQFDSDCKAIVERLRSLTARHRFGTIYGLSLTHTPKSDSWTDDARKYERELTPPEQLARATPSINSDAEIEGFRKWYDEVERTDAEVESELTILLEAGVDPRHRKLANLLADRDAVLKSKGLFKPIRKAVEELREQERAQNEDDLARVRPPADWPFWHVTRGKSAIILGGDRRNEHMSRLRDVFGFGEVGWVTGLQPAKVRNLEQRIANGTVDLVLQMQEFLSHKVSDATWDGQTARSRVILCQSYTVNHVRAGIERFFKAETDPGIAD